MTCEPDYLIMGISALSFFGGAKGAESFAKAIREESGVGTTIGSTAIAAAIAALGGIRRIALPPYWPVMNAEVKRYFADLGLAVVRDTAVHVLDRYCGCDTGRVPRGDPPSRRRRCRCRRASRHEPVDGPLGSGGGSLAGQASDRHQHGDLLACAARQWHPRPEVRFRSLARRTLRWPWTEADPLPIDPTIQNRTFAQQVRLMTVARRIWSGIWGTPVIVPAWLKAALALVVPSPERPAGQHPIGLLS